MRITVAGAGYVGLANAVMLARKHEVTIVDIDESKCVKINRRIPPIGDSKIEEFFANEKLNLTATTDGESAYKDADYIIIATPTDYDTETETFDTSSVESVIRQAVDISPKALMVIKSTVPIGYTNYAKQKFMTTNIIFSPEFLREGKALEDCLYPSRIIVGEKSARAVELAEMFGQAALKEDIDYLCTNSTEAEAIKLFANTYLAMRVAFFNELDTFAECMGLNAGEMICGVCLDPRIGMHYNNPSFGYGGYCLPKDTKQLLSNYRGIPGVMTQAIVSANEVRKEHIANRIAEKSPQVVGIYRLTMKSGSDNFRQSAVFDIEEKLRDKGCEVVVYEPTILQEHYQGMKVINDLPRFKEMCDVIIANRIDYELEEIEQKVYSRDVFRDN